MARRNRNSNKPRRRYHKRGKANNKLTANKIYSFSRYGGTKQTIYLTSTEVNTPFSFQLSDVDSFTDFTTLYDQYKLTGVKVNFRLLTNPDAPSATMTNTFIYPSIWMAPDYDDGSPSTLSTIKEKQGVKRKVLRPNTIISMFVRPKASAMLYNGVSSTAYGLARPIWIDSNNASAPHYGLKTCIETGGPSGLGQYQIEVETKYYFSCKGAQ